MCPFVRLVKLHCRLISTQENFPQERTALELTTLALCNFPSVPILRSVFLSANWPFYITKGRTIRYLRGGLSNNQKKIRAQKQSRKKISCTTNLLKKKIEQGLGVIFKIVVQLF